MSALPGSPGTLTTASWRSVAAVELLKLTCREFFQNAACIERILWIRCSELFISDGSWTVGYRSDLGSDGCKIQEKHVSMIERSGVLPVGG